MEDIHYQKSETDQDLLPIVDDEDRVIGSAPRREIHLKGLKHRSVHIVVVNEKGHLLLQKRSTKKDSHPGFWDISVGGHVDVGEEYDDAASRELEEELGIGAPFHEIGRRQPSAENGWEFVRLYECRFEGPFHPDTEEIDEVRWVDPDEFFEKASYDAADADWKVTGSGLAGIRLWAKCTGIL